MKNISLLFQALFFVIISIGISKGQTTASVYFKKYDELTSFVSEKSKKKSTVESKKEKKNEGIYFDISDVDMSTTVDIRTNSIDFSGVENHKFTKMQLTDKHTNKMVISREIDADFKININEIDRGSYLLILSNKKGDIKSEEIVIL